MIVLTAAEVALLREVRASDEDHGGLAGAELSVDEYDALKRLCALALVEALGELRVGGGTARLREAGASDVVYRITAGGVLALTNEP